MAGARGDRRDGGRDAAPSSTPTRDLYADVLRDKRMCLCGMLAAEYETLPEPMRDASCSFFDRERGLARRVLEQGEREGTLNSAARPPRRRTIVSGLEGAMLIARPYGGVPRFDRGGEGLLSGVMETPPAGRRRRRHRVRTAARRR